MEPARRPPGKAPAARDATPRGSASRLRVARTATRWWSALTAGLPQGQMLPPEAWASRHRAMVWILWLHVLALPVFSLARGHGVVVAVGSVAPIAIAGGAANLRAASRRARSTAVVVGLLTASAVLVNAWDGQIEAHFHFFVVIAVVALYEDWVPFGVAIGYVVAEHGALGAITHRSVYNHPGNPWLWGTIHGGFVLAATAASVVTWRLNEDMRAQMGEAHGEAHENSERFRLAFETGSSGMALCAPDGRYTRVNRALCAMLGFAESELLARDFSSITHPDDRARDGEQHHAMRSGTVDVYETEKRYVHHDGQDVWVQLCVTAVRDAEGAVLYFIVQSHDVTARRKFEAELAHRALHDPLTALPNRALLADRVDHALRRLRRQPGHAALLFIDLDRFKLVNDGMGHDVGDAVLLEAAMRLSAAARAEDTVARFGGDEFVILCERAGAEEARLVADRILAAFSRPFCSGGREFHLSASVGIRVTDSPAATPDLLLRDADLALYAAKAHGRGRHELFDPAAGAPGVDRLRVEHALRTALRDGELVLHYQPEVDLTTGRIATVEALIRWQHPERGLLPPGEFIPVAEESDLIVPIGTWGLGEACEQLARWQRSGAADPALRMAVNVAARQLADPGLPQAVERALTTAGIAAGALCLEITESTAVQDTDVVAANLGALKELGVGLALDDFGTGFSSLSQFRLLPPVDVIKVDRSFTAGLEANESDRAVVTAVLSLADSLHLPCVAEGVENATQLELLRELGCDLGQGFHFARPMPPEAIGSLLADAGRRLCAPLAVP